MSNRSFLLFFFFLIKILTAQGVDNFIWRHYTTSEKFSIQNNDSTYQLQHHFIMEKSDRLFLKRDQLSKIDYFLDHINGKLSIKNKFGITDTLTLYYSYYPLNIPLQWYLNKLIPASDSIFHQPVRKMSSSRENEELGYYKSLNKQGSISRGFSIGTNQSFSLQSGLNFQLTGDLGNNFFIDASLTDKNTPIQPEGNTLALNEVDKVFIKFRSPFVAGILGDYYLEQDQFKLNPVRRKLQGIDISGKYGDQFIQGSYATAEGNFNTNFFVGVEGRQGPYLLKGKNGETDIVVLAGTEKVFINGIQLQRGENYDYVIDYAIGEIKFTSNRPIKGNDRIDIDFEYTSFNQRFGKTYLRSLYEANINTHWKVDLSWFREEDDTKKLLLGSGELSEEEKKIISIAGDNPLLAAQPGAIYVGPGAGNYVDSIDAVSSDTIFVWADRKKGDYAVFFTLVGPGYGDYKRESLGYYRFVGKGKGEYLPIQLLPLPKKYDMFALRTEAQYKNFITELEVNYSNLDKNKFSNLDNGDNGGFSSLWNWNYNNEKLSFLGKTIVRQSWRFRSANFNALDRLNRPDYQNRWALTETGTNNRGDEIENETSILLQPEKNLQFQIDGGYRGEKNYFNAWRLGQRIGLNILDSLSIKENFEHAQSRFAASGNSTIYQTGSMSISKPIEDWRFSLLGGLENREEKKDTLANTGWRKFSVSSNGSWSPDEYNSEINVGLERESAIYPLNWKDYAKSWHVRVGAGISNQNSNAKLNWFHRERKVSDEFQSLTVVEKENILNTLYTDTSMISKKSDLVKLWWRQKIPKINADLRLDYEIGSEQTPIQEKLYVKVEDSRGFFIFDSTLNEWVPDNNGTHVLVSIPTGNYEPVTAVKANLGVNWLGNGLFNNLELNRSGIKRFISELKVRSILQVEEQSKLDDLLSLYLLLPASIQTDSTVSGITSVRHDLYWYYSQKRDFINLRYQSRSSLFRQYLDANDNDRRKFLQWDLLHHLNLGQAFLNDANLKYGRQERVSASAGIKPENITSIGIEEKLTWRFWQNWTQSLALELAKENNNTSSNRIDLFYNLTNWQMIVPFSGKGRVQVNFQRLQVEVLNAIPGYVIPYNMAKGKKEGVSYNWSLNAGYALNQYINLNITYSGRKDSGYTKILHTGQAEVKAFF